jgi:heat shock protein HslJ
MRPLLVVGPVAGLVVLVTGCGSTAPPTHPLDGTSWRLVSIESMDDAQGTTTVDDPTKYMVTFRGDGSAAFRIDCNRGSGSYRTTASSADSGSLTFGPIATTRMACPQPSLEQQVATALGYVRGYRIVDGRLHLSLLADGGILTWEPVAIGSRTPATG